MGKLTTLKPPDIWPECDCGVAMGYVRCFTMRGTEWMWTRQCKHPKKETHVNVLMTADGPYVAPSSAAVL